MKWTKYTSELKDNLDFNRNSFKIINVLGCSINFIHSKKLNSQKTRFIKDTLSILGSVLGYYTYANSLSENLRQTNGGIYKNKEWLYDLHWYTESNKEIYFPLSLPLVMECEWVYIQQGKRKIEDAYSGIKSEFQKLVISNAELRLLIFKVRDIIDLTTIFDAYFENVIKKFEHLRKGDTFLFIVYNNKFTEVYYRIIIR